MLLISPYLQIEIKKQNFRIESKLCKQNILRRKAVQYLLANITFSFILSL